MSQDLLINHVAEQAVLGSMLLDNSLIEILSDRVAPDDFADPLHGRVLTALRRFAAVKKHADAVTLRPVFAADGDAEYGAYLDDLVAAPSILAVADAMADQVADLAARRRARKALQLAIEGLSDHGRSVDEICSAADLAASAASPQTLEAHGVDGLARKVQARAEKVRTDGTPPGLRNVLVDEFDSGLGLLEGGTYNILAGRPGMGKSAAASSLALGFAMNGHCGLYIQHEMTADQMALRIISDFGLKLGHKLKHGLLRAGNLSDSEMRIMREIEDAAALLPLRYVCPGPCDVRKFWTIVAQQKAMWAAQGRKLEFVVADYLGLQKVFDESGKEIIDDRPRMNRVSAYSKQKAGELDVALIALAQIGRGVEQRANKRPNLADLRDSGNLEQDADSVTMLYRHEYYLMQDKPKVGDKGPGGRGDAFEEWQGEYFACRGKMDFIFAKNRHGRTGTKTVRFVGDYSAVRSGSYQEEQEDDGLFEKGGF